MHRKNAAAQKERKDAMDSVRRRKADDLEEREKAYMKSQYAAESKKIHRAGINCYTVHSYSNLWEANLWGILLKIYDTLIYKSINTCPTYGAFSEKQWSAP